MATGIYVPIWGLQMTEATLAGWLVKEGEEVAPGQGVAVLETYKISGEVTSPTGGVVRRQVARKGEVLEVGLLLAVVGGAEEPEEEIERLISQAPKVTDQEVTQPLTQTQEGAAPPSPEGPVPAGPETPSGPAGAQAVRPSSSPVRATPLARKLAKELKVDLSQVTGSGEEGRILRRDIEAAARKSIAPQEIDRPEALPPSAKDRTLELSSLRKAIIHKTMQTVDIPYGALSRKVRMDALLDLLANIKEPFEKRHGLSLSLSHLLFKAAALALEEAPELNSTLDGERIILRGSKNLGMVVTPPGGGGIMIPVLRRVEVKGLGAIAREWAALSERIRAGTQTLEDLSQGTFTISNVGPLGIDLFTPLIHPPESAILGVSRIREEPLVENGRIVAGRCCDLVVGADHRVFDAEPIGRFLTALDRLFQNPAELLI